MLRKKLGKKRLEEGKISPALARGRRDNTEPFAEDRLDTLIGRVFALKHMDEQMALVSIMYA